MALFDPRLFDPQSYQGAGILGGMMPPLNVPQSSGFPGAPPNSGPTYAAGNMGAMGGVPFQIFGQPEQALDMSARSATPPQPAASLPSPPDASSVVPTGGNFSAGLHNLANGFNSGTLFGALSGISDAAQGFSSGVRTDPQGIAIQQLNATYDALKKSGVPDATARAAALNPEILKTIAGAYFDTAPKLQETGADPITGQKSFAVYRANTGTLTPINGQGAGNTVGGIDPSLPPDQILAQADKRYPGVANRVEQLYRGEGGTPNMRQNPLDRFAMQLIQFVHPDWNMTMWTAKNKMQQQLSSSSSASLGGRLQALRNAFDHLANASDTAVAKGNFDLSLSPLSYVANEVKSMTSGQRDLGKQLEREAVTYGGERTKFLTGAEGSEAERRAFLDALGPDSSAPPQMAGTIEGEYTQLKSALLNQEQQIREQLGDAYLKQHPVITPDVKQALARIEQNIAKLRGRAPAQSAPSAPSGSNGLPAGWTVQVK